MKVKDVVRAWHYSDECTNIAILAMTEVGIGLIGIANEEMDGDQYEDDFDTPYWDSEVHQMYVDNGCLTITLE